MRKCLLILLVWLLATAAAPPSGSVFRKRLPPAQYVDQVTNFFSQHRWAKGKELLDEGLELYPNDANLQYLAGRYWWNGKNYDRARYHLVKACQINYHYVDAKSLLVNVEEISGNYSSAICYVNELLEVNPYWKGLWLRKVDLYKKLGNFEEANILLKRLSQIYPNDVSINNDYFDVLETTYQQARVSGDLNAAEESLREIVRLHPNDAEAQLAYANILIRKGRMNDALDILSAAMNTNPGNAPLVKKATDILMEGGRTTAALTLVRSQMGGHPSPELTRLYEQLLEETARIESSADPYVLYARTYNANHSPDALQYLLNQSIKRGFNDDALYYIEEMRRSKGDAPRWYMMEYDAYTRMGHHESAARALTAGLERFPDDYDLNLSASRRRLSEAGESMSEERFAHAVPLLEWVRDHTVDPDLRAVAVRRLALCYRETRRYEEAADMLRERLKTDPEYQVTVDYATLLVKQGQTEQALLALQSSYLEATDSLARLQLGNAFKETAYPYLKENLSNGVTKGLQPICDVILAIDPNDYWGLRYSLRTSDQPLPYALRGIKAYPDDLTFPLKAALLLAQEGREEVALNVLKAYLHDFPADDDLQKTYAGISDAYAGKLLKQKDWEHAAIVLDSALVVRPTDPAVRYTRGLVYEKYKQWDSAYVYQKSYVPAVQEEKEYLARMATLRARTLHNAADVGFDAFRFSDNARLTAIATVGYSHSWKKNAVNARINFTARDPEYDDEAGVYTTSGGRGYQFIAGYSHDFGPLFSVQGTAGYGTAYFPRVVADASLTTHLPLDWDLETGFSYRYLQDLETMIAGSLNLSRSWSGFHAGAKVMLGSMYQHFFFTTSARLRFYPVDGGRSYIEAQAGAGSAPEITFLDSYYIDTKAFNQLNTFAALSAFWALNYNLGLQVSATWNTLYDQRATVSYRNLFIAHVAFTIAF